MNKIIIDRHNGIWVPSVELTFKSGVKPAMARFTERYEVADGVVRAWVVIAFAVLVVDAVGRLMAAGLASVIVSLKSFNPVPAHLKGEVGCFCPPLNLVRVLRLIGVRLPAPFFLEARYATLLNASTEDKRPTAVNAGKSRAFLNAAPIFPALAEIFVVVSKSCYLAARITVDLIVGILDEGATAFRTFRFHASLYSIERKDSSIYPVALPAGTIVAMTTP